jgi:hypothetical protein
MNEDSAQSYHIPHRTVCLKRGEMSRHEYNITSPVRTQAAVQLLSEEREHLLRMA